MKISVKNILDYFSGKPKSLFLLDGLGAGLTTFSLFLILRFYSGYFGMPANILTCLFIIGLVYCAYSMACYFLLKGRWPAYLRIIGVGNFAYCMLTITFLYSYYNSLTRIGLAYFMAEVLIIMVLAAVEFSVANRLRARGTIL